MITSFSGEYEFLSNFHPSPIFVDGHLYSTVEHAYQALKLLNPEDQKQVREAATPGEAKRLGRKFQIKPDWDDKRLSVMARLIILKFMGDRELVKKIAATEDQPLVEGNNWGDQYWGVCDGVGENHLGQLLENVRSVVTEESFIIDAC